MIFRYSSLKDLDKKEALFGIFPTHSVWPSLVEAVYFPFHTRPETDFESLGVSLFFMFGLGIHQLLLTFVTSKWF